jgi:hypothetical protein
VDVLGNITSVLHGYRLIDPQAVFLLGSGTIISGFSQTSFQVWQIIAAQQQIISSQSGKPNGVDPNPDMHNSLAQLYGALGLLAFASTFLSVALWWTEMKAKLRSIGGTYVPKRRIRISWRCVSQHLHFNYLF